MRSAAPIILLMLLSSVGAMSLQHSVNHPQQATDFILVGVNRAPQEQSVQYQSTLEEVSVDPVASVDLKGTGYRVTNHTLDGGDLLSIGKLSRNSSVDLTLVNGVTDLLRYRSNFSDLWNTGSGSLNSQASNTSGLTTVGIKDAIFTNNYAVDVGLQLRGAVTLVLDLRDLDFTLTDTQFGFFNLILEFNSFRTTVTYNASSSYEGIIGNSTAEVVLLHEDLGQLSLNVTALSATAGTERPTSLERIVVNSYVNDVYSLSANFSRIMLLQKVDAVGTDLGNLGQKTLSLELIPEQEVLLSVPLDYYISLQERRSYERVLTVEGELKVLETGVNFTGSFAFEPGELGYFENYRLDQRFKMVKASGVGKTEDGFLDFTPDDTGRTYIEGQLLGKDLGISTPPVIQGSQWRVDLNSSWSLGYLLHQGTGQWLSVFRNRGQVTVDIPLEWPRGKIVLVVIDNEQSCNVLRTVISRSPATVESGTVWNVEATREQLIPVTLLNVSSQESYVPTGIVTTVNGTLRSTNSGYGVIIQPAEFGPGKTTLVVNATHAGYIPVVFDLVLLVAEPVVTVTVTSQRNSAHQGEVAVQVPEVGNWTIGASLRITGDGVNSTAQVTGIVTHVAVENSAWEAEKSYKLDVIVVLDLGLGTFAFSVEIPGLGVVDQGGGSPVLALSVVSLTGVAGTIGFKIYRTKYGEKTISF